MLGETISHYRILERLGKGGMGEVYLAEDIRLGHKVAIKKLPSELAQDQLLRNRFQREAKAVASLRHTAIVPLLEFDEIDGELYLVTEYLAVRPEAGALIPAPLRFGGIRQASND